MATVALIEFTVKVNIEFHKDLSRILLGNVLKPFSFKTLILLNKPFAVSLLSALSGRKYNLNSDRLVNIRYGSLVPWVMRSSIRTPM